MGPVQVGVAVAAQDDPNTAALCLLTVVLLAIPALEAHALNDAPGHNRVRLFDRLLARHPEADKRIASLVTPAPMAQALHAPT